MNKWKIRVVSFSLAVTVAFALLGLAFSPAYAWTHQINNWDNNPNDFLCGTSSDHPCLYWVQPSNTSITLQAYLDSSLTIAPGNYNFTVAIQRAFGDWNAQPAWNPYLNSCGSSISCEDRSNVAYTMADLGANVYGVTYTYYGPSQWNSRNRFWYAAITLAEVNFSSRITWNNNLQFSGTTADGRKVSTHETGHVLGLGHTGHSPAIMRQGAVTYFSVQADDLSGLKSIYPGFYPGSQQ
ncbi:MAG: matrixin family metalloprotease [Ktedonobacteraceae bacterium]